MGLRTRPLQRRPCEQPVASCGCTHCCGLRIVIGFVDAKKRVGERSERFARVLAECWERADHRKVGAFVGRGAEKQRNVVLSAGRKDLVGGSREDVAVQDRNCRLEARCGGNRKNFFR